MPTFIDLNGSRFGRWSVLHRPNGNVKWLCRCDCGTEGLVFGQSLREGRSTSCGCAVKEAMAEKGKTWRLRHGGCVPDGRPVYSVWASMKSRCSNPKTPNFSMYGGRGIKVCDRWQDFENFAADMGLRPEGCSIERIDNDGGYNPENCRWATRKEQNRNTRRNKLMTMGGVTRCLSEWAEVVNIHETVLRQRLFMGWTDEKALTTPVRVLKRRKRN